MEATIKITCQTCNKSHDVRRTSEIPASATSMWCNWCPECEDRAEDYYEEGYNESESEPDIPVPDNQLCLPFIFDELEIKAVEKVTMF